MDEQGQQKGLVTRNFSGLLREMFTDTGNYVCERDASLSPTARSILFATSVAIDFDYFSRSRGGLMGPCFFGGGGWWPLGGGGWGGGDSETNPSPDSNIPSSNGDSGVSSGDNGSGGGWFGSSGGNEDASGESKPWWGEISDALFDDEE